LDRHEQRPRSARRDRKTVTHKEKSMLLIHRVAFLAAVVGLAVVVSPAAAQLPAAPGDWPGWRGPDRTGLSTERGLLQAWPADGPKLTWKASGLGDGFSTPSIAGGRLYVMGADGKTERVICLDLSDGKQLWASPIGSMTGGHPGPRSTPPWTTTASTPSALTASWPASIPPGASRNGSRT
jgi:hypothetical protein